MKQLQELEKLGTNAVKKLRFSKFDKGLPFMINSQELPSNQCYLEYANGKIILVGITGTVRDFTIIRELSDEEVDSIRRKFSLALHNA